MVDFEQCEKLQATCIAAANLVRYEGTDSILKGTFDQFLSDLAKYRATLILWEVELGCLSDSDMLSWYQNMSVDTFVGMCEAFGILPSILTAAQVSGRDWFEKLYFRAAYDMLV